MIWSMEAAEEDADKDPEEVTMNAITSIASSILQCLDFTWDAPGRNPSGTMPLLDTMIWVGYPSRT